MQNPGLWLTKKAHQTGCAQIHTVSHSLAATRILAIRISNQLRAPVFVSSHETLDQTNGLVVDCLSVGPGRRNPRCRYFGASLSRNRRQQHLPPEAAPAPADRAASRAIAQGQNG